jgi:hypothetical protein
MPSCRPGGGRGFVASVWCVSDNNRFDLRCGVRSIPHSQHPSKLVQPTRAAATLVSLSSLSRLSLVSLSSPRAELTRVEQS